MDRNDLIIVEGIIRGIILIMLLIFVYFVSITLSPEDPLPLAIILSIITAVMYTAGSIWYTIFRKK